VPARQPTDAMYHVLGLALPMFEDRDEDDILRLAGESIDSTSSCRLEAGYLVHEGTLTPSRGRTEREIRSQVEMLRGEDGTISLPERGWCRAVTLRHAGRHHGYLVVSAPVIPAGYEIHLLALLAEHTSLALANAFTHRGDEERIRRLREERAAADDLLAITISDLKRQQSIHRSLYAASASGDGEPGIARALHRITGLPTAVEDNFGNPRAWAGPGRPDPYPKASPQQRQELLREVTRRGPVARIKDRLVAVAATGDDMFGVVALVDPERTAGRHELLALEHGAMVLTGELAHQHDMIEMERKLRRGLVEDLLTGDGGTSAYERSRAVDHDLHGPHHVVAIRWDHDIEGALTQAAEHAAAGLGISSLASAHDGMTVLLARGRPDGPDLHHAIARRLRTETGAIGIGGRCDSPREFPRSFHEALLALDVRLNSSSPDGSTLFDNLGVLRVLDTGDGGAKIRQYVRDWLGPLLDYDTRSGSELVRTLSRHLDCGGNYDDTAAALVIHRSTLRYRLQRIREISRLDITDVGNRLNLHVATRAWQIIGGLGEPADPV